MEQTQEIQKHRIQMMTEKERREREQQEANRAMLQNKREHDLKVYRIEFHFRLTAYFPFLCCTVPPSTAGEGTTSLSGGQRAATVPQKSGCRERKAAEGRKEGGERNEQLQPTPHGGWFLV